jgi:hypothetical protein
MIPNRAEIHSQGGQRVPKSNLKVTEAEQKRAASAYGSAQNNGQRRNLVVYSGQNQVVAVSNSNQPDPRPVSRESKAHGKMNNFFEYAGKGNTINENYQTIPKRTGPQQSERDPQHFPMSLKEDLTSPLS